MSGWVAAAMLALAVYAAQSGDSPPDVDDGLTSVATVDVVSDN